MTLKAKLARGPTKGSIYVSSGSNSFSSSGAIEFTNFYTERPKKWHSFFDTH